MCSIVSDQWSQRDEDSKGKALYFSLENIQKEEVFCFLEVGIWGREYKNGVSLIEVSVAHPEDISRSLH